MSREQSARQGVTWVFAGNTGNQAISFALGIVLARLLVPADFGMLLTIQVFTGLAGFIVGGGMGQALVRAKSVCKEDYDVVFTLQMMISLLIYLTFFIAAPWIARWYDNPIFVDLLRLSALSFLVRPFVSLSGSLLYRAKRYKARASVGLVTLLSSGSVSIGLAYSGHGVWSLLWGGIASTLTAAVLLMWLARWRPGISFDLRRGREIASYGVLVSVNDFLDYLQGQVSIFILSRTLGLASIGLFNKGHSLAEMPHKFITGSVYQVLFREMAAVQDDLDKCRYLYTRSVVLVSIYATPFYVGLIWLAEPLILAVYGEKWAAAVQPLQILCLAWPFWLLGNLSGAALAARNWLARELPVQVTTLIVMGLAVLAALPYGINGVAWALVGAFFYRDAYLYWLGTRCLQLRLMQSIRALAPACALNVTLALTLFVTDLCFPMVLRQHQFAYLAGMVTTGVLAYGLAFLFFRFEALRTEQNRWRARLGLQDRDRFHE